jgi:hypothetical protein
MHHENIHPANNASAKQDISIPGYFRDAKGNDSASTMCQWRVLSFIAAMVSIVLSKRGTER